MSPEENAVKEVYEALNKNSFQDFLRLFDPQVLRVEFEGLPTARTCHGHAELKAHFEQGRATWAEGACEPEKLIVAGDKVVALVHVRVRLKNHTDWLEGRLGDVFKFKNGKIIEFRTFEKREDALKWAGI